MIDCQGLTQKSMADLGVTSESVYVRLKVLLWFVADITKNVLKEHAKAFNQVFERAKKDLQKVHKNMLGYLLSTLLKDLMDMQGKHDKRQKLLLLNQTLVWIKKN